MVFCFMISYSFRFSFPGLSEIRSIMMRYKSLLCCVVGYLLFSVIGAQTSGQETTKRVHGVPKVVDNENRSVDASDRIPNAITIFLCGDVMTGRGIDQILPHPSDPTIYESYMKSAQGYVKIAEEVNGSIDFPVSFSYIWGNALKEMDRPTSFFSLVSYPFTSKYSSTFFPTPTSTKNFNLPALMRKSLPEKPVPRRRD